VVVYVFKTESVVDLEKFRKMVYLINRRSR
jgi:hypothetical protein